MNLLRFFGRYIRIIALLPTLGSKSAHGIIDLYEFFFASICQIFGSEGSECVGRLANLANILEELQKKFPGPWPSRSPSVQIAFIDNLYGAAERIIAVDSIEFVARQLDLIRPVIESLLVEDVSLDAFYSRILPCHTEAKTLIIDVSTSRSLRLKSLVESVASVNWDISELRSQHSPYVTALIQDFEVFGVRIKAIRESDSEAGTPVNLTSSMEKFFWERCIHYAFKALVQGYGDGGKCSTEGRSLMQLDFQNILMKLEPLCGMKPVPHAHFVDSYIKVRISNFKEAE